MQWPEPLRRLPEPWPTFFEGSYVVGPTPEGTCLLLVDADVLGLASSLYVSLKLLRSVRLVHPGATGVVIVDKARYQGLVERTVELVGIRSHHGGHGGHSAQNWNHVANVIPTEHEVE